jgi:hypothetical protein
MAMLNCELGIQQVVFTQDDKRGSITTLTCVNPEFLRGHANFNVGTPNFGQTTSAQPPSAPPPSTQTISV